MFAIDLDEVEALDRNLRLFSLNASNIYSFREADFLPSNERLHNPAQPSEPTTPPPSGSSLKSRVIARLANDGIDLAGGRVVLLTLPRVFGYLFNPVSFYYCFDRHGKAVAAIAEVTNTFKEMKPFVLGPATCSPGGEGSPAAFSQRVPKYFYVSPFTDMDVAFDFSLATPGDKLSVQIDDYDANRRTLTSVLQGHRESLTDSRLAWYTLKYPLITLRIISLIHWHALKLYLKKIPWFAKAARPEAQRDLYRPHISIAHQPEA